MAARDVIARVLISATLACLLSGGGPPRCRCTSDPFPRDPNGPEFLIDIPLGIADEVTFSQVQGYMFLFSTPAQRALGPPREMSSGALLVQPSLALHRRAERALVPAREISSSALLVGAFWADIGLELNQTKRKQ